MDDDASHGSPGRDLVPLSGARVVPRELAVAADLVLGAGSRTVGVALRLGSAGVDVARLGGRITAALPGAGLASRAVSAAARPLVADGARMRDRAVAQAQRALEQVVPAIVELTDVDAIVRQVDADAPVRRVDADALLARVDVDALLRRTDVDTLLQRVDVDAFLAGVDIDTVIARIDVDAIAARIDVNAIVQQVDIDTIVEQTEIGTIVARSTSGFASEALDAARAQTVGADTLVTRLVERVMRRRTEGPPGPPLLVPEQDEPPPPSAPTSAPEAGPPPPPPPDAPLTP
ncbi:MAG TPA: hypothetical protein VKB03_11370 [Conexibacter sp.]|nr:hypothetical protein [Conexibacter sp.]